MANSISTQYKLPFDTSCPHCGNTQVGRVTDNLSPWQRRGESRDLTLMCLAPVAEGQDDSHGRDRAQWEAERAHDEDFLCGMQWDPWDTDEAYEYEMGFVDDEDMDGEED